MAEQEGSQATEGRVVTREHEMKPGAPGYTPRAGTGQQGDTGPESLQETPPPETRRDDAAEGERED